MLKYINENTNTQEEYGYACGRIRELEKTLLSQDLINKMIDSNDFEDCLKVLEEGSIENYNINATDKLSIDNVLDRILKKTVLLIKEISPNPYLYKLLSWKYDFHNLKVLLKTKFLGKKDVNQIYYDIGNLEKDKLEKAVYDDKFQVIPGVLERIIKESEDEFMKSSDLQLMEILVDSGYYEIIFNLIEEINHPFLFYFFKREIDLLNLLISCRCKIRDIKKSKLPNILIKRGNLSIQKFMNIYENPIQSWSNFFQKSEYEQLVIEGLGKWEEENSLIEIEKLVDNYLLNLLKIGKYTCFGIESVFAYYYAKENDIRNIRIILNGKKYLLNKNIIKKNIRDCYV